MIKSPPDASKDADVDAVLARLKAAKDALAVANLSRNLPAIAAPALHPLLLFSKNICDEIAEELADQAAHPDQQPKLKNASMIEVQRARVRLNEHCKRVRETFAVVK